MQAWSGVPYKNVRELRERGCGVRFNVGYGYEAIKVEMHNEKRVNVDCSESTEDGKPQVFNAVQKTPNSESFRNNLYLVTAAQ